MLLLYLAKTTRFKIVAKFFVSKFGIVTLSHFKMCYLKIKYAGVLTQLCLGLYGMWHLE